MKTGHHLPCASCRLAWVSVPYSTPHTVRVLCTACQPKAAPRIPPLKRFWRAIYGRTRPVIGAYIAPLALLLLAVVTVILVMVPVVLWR